MENGQEKMEVIAAGSQGGLIQFDGPRAVEIVKRRIATIQQIMREIMIGPTPENPEGVHFGPAFPGSKKPSLLQAGAQLLCSAFQLSVKREQTMKELGNGHREYHTITRVYDSNGIYRGEGVGVCSTLETKYRWRDASRKCPKCGGEFIIKGKAEFGGGWLCFAKKGGCGAKYRDDDKAITEQKVGRIENMDIADVYNTCAKISCKRSDVHGTIVTLACADMVTQDGEDFSSSYTDAKPVKAKVISKEVIKDENGNTVNTQTGEVLRKAPEPVNSSPVKPVAPSSTPHKVTTPFDDMPEEQKKEEQAAAAMQDDAPPAGGPEAFAKEINEQNAATNGEKLITPVQLKAMQTLRGQIGWSPEQLKAWVLKAFPYIEVDGACSSKNLKRKDASFILSTLEHCVKTNTQPA